jgi:hypothetical protein
MKQQSFQENRSKRPMNIGRLVKGIATGIAAVGIAYVVSQTECERKPESLLPEVVWANTYGGQTNQDTLEVHLSDGHTYLLVRERNAEYYETYVPANK